MRGAHGMLPLGHYLALAGLVGLAGVAGASVIT